MSEAASQQQSYIQRFLAHLSGQVRDRGVMADLRHGLSRGTEYRAWPHVAPWCSLDNDRQRRIVLTIAAGFAVHQRMANSGNMGTVLRSLATGGGRGVDGLATFDGRFRRLLACASAAEVCDHLVGVLRAAERNSIAVNFEQLYWDLTRWGEKAKVSWAAEYWGAPPDQPQGDEQADDEFDGLPDEGGEQ